MVWKQIKNDLLCRITDILFHCLICIYLLQYFVHSMLIHCHADQVTFILQNPWQVIDYCMYTCVWSTVTHMRHRSPEVPDWYQHFFSLKLHRLPSMVRMESRFSSWVRIDSRFSSIHRFMSRTSASGVLLRAWMLRLLQVQSLFSRVFSFEEESKEDVIRSNLLRSKNIFFTNMDTQFTTFYWKEIEHTFLVVFRIF